MTTASPNTDELLARTAHGDRWHFEKKDHALGEKAAAWERAEAARRASQEQAQHLERQLLATLSAIRRLAENSKHIPQKETFYRELVEYYDEFCREESSHPDIRHEQAYGYGIIGSIQATLGEREKAERSVRRSVAMSKRLKDDFPAEVRFSFFHAENLNNTGVLLFDLGWEKEALQAMSEAVQECDRIATEHPKHSNSRADLALFLGNLAGCLVRCRDPQLRDPFRAIGLAKRATQMDPGRELSWRVLGLAGYRAGQWEEARLAMEKHLQLTKGGSATGWLLLSMICQQQGNPALARRWYDKADRCMEQYKERVNDDLRRFRAEAAIVLGIADAPKPREKEGSSRKD